MTPNEVYRTAFKRLTPNPFSGVVEICPYCKNQSPDKVMDQAELNEFRKFYGERSFDVYSCTCSATWSVS